MLSFPTSPTANQIFSPSLDLPVWQWDGDKWVTLAAGRGEFVIRDAPADGTNYGRGDYLWRPTLHDAPHDGQVYGRLAGTWLWREVVETSEESTFLAINARLDPGLTWHYRINGCAGIISLHSDAMFMHPASLGTAGAQILWHPGMLLNANGLYVNHGYTWQGLLAGGLVANQLELGANDEMICHQNGQQHTGWGLGLAYHAFTWNWPSVAGHVHALIAGGGAIIALASASDERLKQDIALSTLDCLALLRKLPLHQYRWMDESDPNEPRLVEPTDDNLVPVGLIAQKLYEVAPFLVDRPPDVQAVMAPLRSPLYMWSIEQNNLIALLCGAIQQLSARIRTLEAAYG
jgi:hypothetical protein